MIVVELVAAIDAAGTLKTLLVTDAGWTTKPTDTPANEPANERLMNPGELGLSIFGDGRTAGGTTLEVGAVELAALDGDLDPWRTYGFDGRPVIIRSGPVDGDYPADFTTILTATVDGAIEASEELLTLRLRDKAFMLTPAVLTDRFLGTNVGSTGLEGLPGDLKGTVKPRLFGVGQNITPKLANAGNLTYRVSTTALAYILPVDDSGVALANTGDVANAAALAAAAIGAGDFKTCLAEGLFRCGALPVGQITAWAAQGANAAARTTAQVLKALALAAGVAGGDINAADVTALDTAAPGEVGLWIDDERSFREAMDEVAASAGAYYAFDRLGVLRMGQLVAPSGTPVHTIEDWEACSIALRSLNGSAAIPVADVRLDYSRNYTPQTTGLAGSVSAADRAFLGKEYRSVSAAAASVKLQYLTAGIHVATTQLVDATRAQTEATRLLNLYKVRREMFDITVPLSVVLEYGLFLLSLVSVVYDRWDMEGGRLFLTIGIRLELASEQAVLTVWG